jgi:hypothetical protein
VTHEQLGQALDRQRQTGERLGEALVGQGVLSKFELAGSLAEQASLAEAPEEPESEPAPIVHLTPRVDAAFAMEPGPGLVPARATEPGYGTTADDAAQPETAGCVAFASTPRGYRLVTLEEGRVPEVGERVELPELGELVVLRRGASPLPLDERSCVFLEPLVPAKPTA